MNEPDELFSSAEVETAERLDRAIDATAADPVVGADGGVARLLLALRADVPDRVRERVAGAVAAPVRRLAPRARLVAVALAIAFAVHGVGNLVNGRWVADHLGEPYGSHAFREGGLALLALAVVLTLASWRRSLVTAVAAGVPVGLPLGVLAVFEAGEFPAGGVLHGIEGVLALALLVLWWRARRYAPAPTHEERT